MTTQTNGTWIDDNSLPDFLRCLSEEDLLIGLAGLGSLSGQAKNHAFDIFRAGHDFKIEILDGLVNHRIDGFTARQSARDWVRSVLK